MLACVATKESVAARINLDVRELRRQLKTKCVNQCDRTLRDVGAALLDRLTALEGKLSRR